MITDVSQNTSQMTNSLNTSTTTTTTNSAMSLWHKFATWQNEMDQCRTMVRDIRQEQDQIRRNIEVLHHIRKAEQLKIQEMEPSESPCSDVAESSVSDEQLHTLRLQLDEAEGQYKSALASFQLAQQNDHAQTVIRNDIIQETIDQSRAFHQLCQQVQCQLRTTATTMSSDVVHATSNKEALIETSCKVHTLRAALYAANASIIDNSNGTDGTKNDSWILKTIQDLQDCKIPDTDTMAWNDLADSNDENDPTTWNVSKEKDDEMYRAVERYNVMVQKHHNAMTEQKEAQIQYDTFRRKMQDRELRKVQLQAQLQRIQSDCEAIESEIDHCQSLTVEDEALAQMYRTSTLKLCLFTPLFVSSQLDPQSNATFLFSSLRKSSFQK
jgi:chromosome segregation ATPase